MHNKVLVTGMSLHCIVGVYREVNNCVMLYSTTVPKHFTFQMFLCVNAFSWCHECLVHSVCCIF